MIIRKPKFEDFEAIYSLLAQLWPNKNINKEKEKAVFNLGLYSHNQEYRILIFKDRVLGFASLTIKNSLWQEGNMAHLDEIVVDKVFRGQGFGTKLLDSMIKIAKDRSCMKIELDSAYHRKKAHEFYEKKDFNRRAHLFSLDLVS